MDQGREKLEKTGSLETPKTAEAPKPIAPEVKTRASEVIRPESPEAALGQEGVELSQGKVSEIAAEDKTYAPQAGKKAYSADEIEAIRAKLLAALPPQEVMMRQIRKTLSQKERVLTKRMKIFQKKSHTHAFHLAIVVAQMRKLREYFSKLVHATYEMVKHLWLEIVHGV